MVGPTLKPYPSSDWTNENAQAIAVPESPNTAKLYDWTNHKMTPDEIERLAI